jgi:hypothetical protein
MKIIKGLMIAGAAVVLASGAALAVVPSPGTPSLPDSAGGVTPYIIAGANQGGNRTCGEVGTAYFGNAGYYQCFSDKIDFPFGSNTFSNISSEAACNEQIPSITVEDETSVSFSASPHGLGALIVKGGSDANTYVYEPQAATDSGLASPLVNPSTYANLSNLTVCWNPAGDNPACLENETAWAAGSRYVSRGNWATYTPYAQGSVILYAGQTMPAGTVQFSAPSDEEPPTVTITVTLNSGWQFSSLPGETDGEFDNNLKVQDYGSAPSDNPSPGLFRWKTVCTGSTCSIEVPKNSFYGVHVDVAQEVECPADVE